MRAALLQDICKKRSGKQSPCFSILLSDCVFHLSDRKTVGVSLLCVDKTVVSDLHGGSPPAASILQPFFFFFLSVAHLCCILLHHTLFPRLLFLAARVRHGPEQLGAVLLRLGPQCSNTVLPQLLFRNVCVTVFPVRLRLLLGGLALRRLRPWWRRQADGLPRGGLRAFHGFLVHP